MNKPLVRIAVATHLTVKRFLEADGTLDGFVVLPTLTFAYVAVVAAALCLWEGLAAPAAGIAVVTGAVASAAVVGKGCYAKMHSSEQACLRQRVDGAFNLVSFAMLVAHCLAHTVLAGLALGSAIAAPR